MARAFYRSLLAALGLGFILASVLAGCAESLVDKVPTELGGLPSGTPTRPTTPYQYPAVHDMPPPRSTTPLSEEDQFKLERELQALRDRQAGGPPKAKITTPAGKAGAKPEPKKDKDKKKPGAAGGGQAAGVKSNP
jgi:hypothetical protein